MKTGPIDGHVEVTVQELSPEKETSRCESPLGRSWGPATRNTLLALTRDAVLPHGSVSGGPCHWPPPFCPWAELLPFHCQLVGQHRGEAERRMVTVLSSAHWQLLVYHWANVNALRWADIWGGCSREERSQGQSRVLMLGESGPAGVRGAKSVYLIVGRERSFEGITFLITFFTHLTTLLTLLSLINLHCIKTLI